MSTKQQLADYIRYKNSAWAFLSECVFTRDAVDAENPVKLFPAHREYLRLFALLWQREKMIAVPKSRRMTMSWTVIALTLWDCIFHKGREHAFVSKKEDDSAELVARAEFIFNKIPKDKIPRTLLPKIRGGKMTKSPPRLIFDFGNDDVSYIAGFPMGADQLRQFTFSGIFGDEAAFWEVAEEFYTGAKPTLDGGGRMVLVSSRSPGFFKKIVFDQINSKDDNFAERAPDMVKRPLQGVEIWRNPKNKFLIIDIHYTADPDKRSPKWRKKLVDSMPLHQFMREYDRSWNTYTGQPVYPNFRPDIHCPVMPPKAHLGLPLLIGWDFGHCYDDETEVLTENGWKLFKDVNKKEKVATLNPETFQLEYEQPSLYYSKEWEGELIDWDSQNLQASITPEHITPVWSEAGNFKRMYAKDLYACPGHNKIRLTASWEGKTQTNPLHLSPSVFASFMGLYLSDGSVDQNSNRVIIYQNKPDDWIASLLKKTPYKWTRGVDCWRTSDQALADYLRTFGKQESRFIPAEILNGTSSNILSFINTYTLGDGHKRAKDHTIFSISKRMVDDLSEAALKVGWYSYISERGPTESWYEAEQKYIKSSGGYVISFKKKAKFAELRNVKQTKRKYKGTIYCLKVTHHTLYVRKNGRPHWNGNTPACVVGQLQGSSLKVLKEFVTKNESIRTFSPKVMSQIKVLWPEWDNNNQYHFVDPAGFKKSENDFRSCVMEMQEYAGIENIEPGPVTWESRRTAVENFLISINKDHAGIELNEEECPTLVGGFKGGYRYPDSSNDIQPDSLRPIKNYFSHCHDALQYLCSGAALNLDNTSTSFDIPTPNYGFQKSSHNNRNRGKQYGLK